MAGKSPRTLAYEEKRSLPTGNVNTRGHLKIKKKDVYFRYISVCREKYRYKVLRYLGCILSDPQKWFDHTLEYIKSWGIFDVVW